MASVMSRQGPGEGVSSPQRLFQLHGQREGVEMQWMTLSADGSFMLQGLIFLILL